MDGAGILWPGERLYEVLGHLCEEAGLVRRGAEVATPVVDAAGFTESVALAARQLGVEAHPAHVLLDRLESELWRAAPALVRIDREDQTLLIAIAGGTPRQLAVVGTDGAMLRVDPASIRALAPGGDAPERSAGASPVQANRAAGGNPPDRSFRDLDAARARLLELAGRAPEAGERARVWQLRPSAGASLWRQLVAARLQRRVAVLASLHVLRLMLLAFSWWMLGRGALDGTLDGALLAGWMLVLGTFVAVAAVVEWVQGHLLLDLNLRYRRKTMHGATRVAPAVARSLGSGQLLGRVFETEALDTLAVNAAIGAISAALDVVFAVALFLLIPGAELLAVVFAAWLALIAARGVWVCRRQRTWTLARIAMSEDVVEGLLGRRTRLAQLGARRFHPIEDRILERYVGASAVVDGAEASFESLAGRGWLLVGLLALAAAAGLGSLSAGATAAALGAVLLGFQALTRVAASMYLVGALVISWRQARVLYRASGEPELVGVAGVVEAERAARADRPGDGQLVQARSLRHRPQPDREPVIDGISLSVTGRERILMTGPSGGGKSTLARLLCGLERATSGTISLRGLDLGALGDQEWARRIAYVPPFGDNHVFSASLLYNLLPGSWPPSPGEIAEAERVCHELGLGPLLGRMPSQLRQIVGETGWRLSHGERARLFLARALLQRPELVILDECFGALDAATMKECMDCALRRSPALLVISHV
jgi:ATP-binding cassette, subfamily B, bacterial